MGRFRCSESAMSGASVRMIRVLVVEDDFGDYDATLRALGKMMRFRAVTTRANSLEAARHLMSKHRYDVLFVDYNLGMDCGARLLHEIGGRLAGSAPILLTGLIDAGIQEKALEAGAICCINKVDLSPSLLEATIQSALFTHKLENEAAALLRSLAAPLPHGQPPASSGFLLTAREGGCRPTHPRD